MARLPHECESRPSPFGRAANRRTICSRSTVPSRLMATVCRDHQHPHTSTPNGVVVVSTHALTEAKRASAECSRQRRGETRNRERPLVNGHLPREPTNHIETTEPTFACRSRRHLTRQALRHHEGNAMLNAERPDRPPKLAIGPPDDSDRLGAPAQCRTKDSSPPTGPTLPTGNDREREDPNSRVLSDTSREVRYLSTRSAR